MKPRLSKYPLIIPATRQFILQIIGASLLFISAACTIVPMAQPTPSPIPLAKELVLYDWEEDIPQSVLDAFTAEYGVPIRYLVYESQEEAMDNIRAGQVYDVVVMESRFIPMLIDEGLLAKLHQENMPNLKNISANFRELGYDPGNRYSIPFNWGTTGLVVRSDLIEDPVTCWADLWDPQFAGQVGLWMGQPRDVISLTLKSLGYSANSENPQELEHALRRLLELKPNTVALEDYDLSTSAEALASGEVVLAMGYAYDVLEGREKNPAITYVLPDEGTLLWNDTFVVPGNTPNQFTAELFLNFLNRPEINAMIVNENLYATPNEAAYPFIDPDMLKDPIIFPSNNELADAELILPLTAEGRKLYTEIWERFMAAP